jgi:hypothetical protein
MKDVMDVDLKRILQDDDKARMFIATQYLNASEELFAGLKRQHKDNIFHFVISLRSFIEYTRRGVWFLCWADPKQIKEAYRLTFAKSGSPPLVAMDAMMNERLGKGAISALKRPAQGIGEPFINSLHALTHGNPISVRFLSFGMEKIFNTEMLLLRAEIDLSIFRILLCRMMLGEKQEDIWRMLSTIENLAASSLQDAGGPEKFFGLVGQTE